MCQNSREVIYSMANILKSGGRLVLTTPNKSPFPRNAVWATDLPPVHLWWLSEESFIYLSQQMGYTCDFVDFRNYNKKHAKPILMPHKDYSRPIGSPRLAADGTIYTTSVGSKLKSMMHQNPLITKAAWSVVSILRPSDPELQKRRKILYAILKITKA